MPRHVSLQFHASDFRVDSQFVDESPESLIVRGTCLFGLCSQGVRRPGAGPQLKIVVQRKAFSSGANHF